MDEDVGTVFERSANVIKQQTIDESFRKDVIVRLSDHVAVVVNDLTADDQGTLMHDIGCSRSITMV